MLHSSLIHG